MGQYGHYVPYFLHLNGAREDDEEEKERDKDRREDEEYGTNLRNSTMQPIARRK